MKIEVSPKWSEERWAYSQDLLGTEFKVLAIVEPKKSSDRLGSPMRLRSTRDRGL
ncbi:uncharacterized protein PHALS_14474 [Plasmopara halstedii]|uniref:Uncharacterized protein n=1 Tax=Plasmopara halstedii TaxID=4781 RepID=A0A0P1AU90_PLAHL|nr:uncharacterized protein PHALS_14474 [Plasmopara halstedii]CEG44216.1 hypothetical protein PHALS_14474 [Plasmopara halstedii]|eukprot:XP_024580585.1 hypothetical protein PHALS_14474 [Plasmopara halstedii]